MSSGKEEKGGRASLVKKEEREEGSPSEKGRKKGRPPPLQKEEINSESYDWSESYYDSPTDLRAKKFGYN